MLCHNSVFLALLFIDIWRPQQRSTELEARAETGERATLSSRATEGSMRAGFFNRLDSFLEFLHQAPSVMTSGNRPMGAGKP